MTSKVRTTHEKASTLRIGRCGELLVQYKLLKLGIESAAMTTDSGIDLVAFASKAQRAVTIQVKANDAAKPGGGKGKFALDWWIADNCPSELAAFVDLSTDSAWLLSKPELATMASNTQAVGSISTCTLIWQRGREGHFLRCEQILTRTFWSEKPCSCWNVHEGRENLGRVDTSEPLVNVA